MKKMKAMKKLLFAMILTMTVSCPAPGNAVMPVFDSVGWLQAFTTYLIEIQDVAENTISATNETAQTAMQIEQLVNELMIIANQIESLANEADSLKNQATALKKYEVMLEKWALQLAKLEAGDFWGFLEGISGDIDGFNNLLGETRGIIKEQDGADTEFDEIYDTFEDVAPLSTEEYLTKEKQWTQEQANTGYDAAKMMTLLKNSETDMVHTAEAMANIESAEGDVGVLQGLAQLQAIQIKQRREMMQLMSANNQINAINTATTAAQKDQSRKEAARFIEGHTEYIEVAPVTNYKLQ